MYDLKHDPYELRDLVNFASHTGVQEAMRQRLLRCLRQVEGPTPEIDLAPTEASGQFATPPPPVPGSPDA